MKEPEQIERDLWTAKVSIQGRCSMAEIRIDGRRVNGVIGYKIEQHAAEMPDPILTLQMRCELDLDSNAVPLLPEPFTWVYKPIVENFVGRGNREPSLRGENIGSVMSKEVQELFPSEAGSSEPTAWD